MSGEHLEVGQVSFSDQAARIVAVRHNIDWTSPLGGAIQEMIRHYDEEFENVRRTATELGVGVEYELTVLGYAIRASADVPVGEIRLIGTPEPGSPEWLRERQTKWAEDQEA